MKGLWNVFQNHICNRVTNAIQVHLENAAITHMDWSRSPLNFIIHLTRLRVWAWDSDECAGSPFPPYSDSDITVSPSHRMPGDPGPGPRAWCLMSSAVPQSQPGSDGINKSASDPTRGTWSKQWPCHPVRSNPIPSVVIVCRTPPEPSPGHWFLCPG